MSQWLTKHGARVLAASTGKREGNPWFWHKGAGRETMSHDEEWEIQKNSLEIVCKGISRMPLHIAQKSHNRVFTLGW